MRCPTPEKQPYATRREAEQVLRWAWRKGRGGRLPVRTYKCPCTQWHLTSKPRK